MRRAPVILARVRPTVLLLVLAATGCHAGEPAVRSVLLDGCVAPQAAYAAAHVGDMDALGGARFALQTTPGATSADVLVRCGVLADGSAATLDLGLATVTIDPARVVGEAAFAAAMLHALAHWQIHAGPHPERATRHACPRPDALGPDPSLCDAAGYDPADVMAPPFAGTGDGRGGWATGIERLAAPPDHAVFTPGDAAFYARAVAP